MYVCMYVCIYACMCICVCVYVCMRVHARVNILVEDARSVFDEASTKNSADDRYHSVRD